MSNKGCEDAKMRKTPLTWLHIDLFTFRWHYPDCVEEEHAMVMGLRSDMRVYYARCPLPEKIRDIWTAYRELRKWFNTFLEAPVTTDPYTEGEYADLVRYNMQRYSATMLDDFPVGPEELNRT